MSTTFTDLSFVDRQVATRLEATQAWRAVRYAAASAQHSRTADAAQITVAGAQVIYGGEGLPVNRAIGLGMMRTVTEAELDEIEHFYTKRRADTLIDLCPLADSSLLRLLQTRGYHLRGWMSMLYMPLSTVPAPTEANPTIRVTRATPAQADLWLTTSARGFDEREDVAASTLRVLTPNFYAANAYCYFAWYQEEQEEIPIATAGMYPHAGAVELGGTSTLLAYRQRGAQSTLIQQRLADAHALGCDLVAVLTTPGSASQRNMQRRGFHLAYTRAIAVRPLRAGD